MASNLYSEQCRTSLVIDKGYVDPETSNYDDPIILSPSLSTEKLIKDGKIRRCFVALEKNWFCVANGAELSAFTNGAINEINTVSGLRQENKIVRCDYNANETTVIHEMDDRKANPTINNMSNVSFKQAESKTNRKKYFSLKNDVLTKTSGETNNTRNVFSSILRDQSIHSGSSCLSVDTTPIVDSDHQQAVKKAKLSNVVKPSIHLCHGPQSPVISSAVLVNSGTVAEESKPIEYTGGWKSNQGRFKRRRRKKGRPPNVSKNYSTPGISTASQTMLKAFKSKPHFTKTDLSGQYTCVVEPTSKSNLNMANTGSKSSSAFRSEILHNKKPVQNNTKINDLGTSVPDLGDQENSYLQLSRYTKRKTANSLSAAFVFESETEASFKPSVVLSASRLHFGKKRMSQEDQHVSASQVNANDPPVSLMQCSEHSNVEKNESYPITKSINKGESHNQISNTNSLQSQKDDHSDLKSGQDRLCNENQITPIISSPILPVDHTHCSHTSKDGKLNHDSVATGNNKEDSDDQSSDTNSVQSQKDVQYDLQSGQDRLFNENQITSNISCPILPVYQTQCSNQSIDGKPNHYSITESINKDNSEDQIGDTNSLQSLKDNQSDLKSGRESVYNENQKTSIVSCPIDSLLNTEQKDVAQETSEPKVCNVLGDISGETDTVIDALINMSADFLKKNNVETDVIKSAKQAHICQYSKENSVLQNTVTDTVQGSVPDVVNETKSDQDKNKSYTMQALTEAVESALQDLDTVSYNSNLNKNQMDSENAQGYEHSFSRHYLEQLTNATSVHYLNEKSQTIAHSLMDQSTDIVEEVEKHTKKKKVPTATLR